MTTEEKAKAYDKAVNIAKKMINDLRKGEDILAVSELETMFPELKESKDEKISREITEFILTHRIDEPNDIEDTNSWLAWLEKQAPKPKWSDEDEEELEIAIETLHEAGQHSSAIWLKSLKQRNL